MQLYVACLYGLENILDIYILIYNLDPDMGTFKVNSQLLQTLEKGKMGRIAIKSGKMLLRFRNKMIG